MDKNVDITLNIKTKLSPAAQLGTELKEIKKKVGDAQKELDKEAAAAQRRMRDAGALGAMRSNVGGLLGTVRGGLSATLGSVASGSPLGAASSLIGMGGAGAAAIGGPAGLGLSAGASAMQSILGLVSELPARAQQLASVVAVNNPAKAERFNRTMRDLTGTIGHYLSPALDIATKGFRTVADTIAGSAELRNSTARFFRELSSTFNELQPTLVRLTAAVADLISGTLTAIRKVDEARKTPAGQVTQRSFLRSAASVAGGPAAGAAVSLAQNTPSNVQATPGASYGMAAVPATYESYSGYGRSARLRAYSAGAGSPAERSAGSLDRIEKKIDGWEKHNAQHIVGQNMRQAMNEK